MHLLGIGLVDQRVDRDEAPGRRLVLAGPQLHQPGDVAGHESTAAPDADRSIVSATGSSGGGFVGYTVKIFVAESGSWEVVMTKWICPCVLAAYEPRTWAGLPAPTA